MDSTDPNELRLQQLSQSYSALYTRCRNNETIINNLERTYVEVQGENGKVLKDIADLKEKILFADRGNEMCQINKQRLEEQRVLYEETVIPQLKKELKEKQDFNEAKQMEYDEYLKFYQEKWESYLTIYMRFPGAAERVAAQNKTKLMRIEIMKKEQMVIEKAKQAAQLQEIKAQRLQILQKEVMKWYAIEHESRRKMEELKKDVEVRKARIAAKEAAKLEEARRLEEERQEQEDQSQQEVQAAQEMDQNSASQDEPISSFLKAINYKNYKILMSDIQRLDYGNIMPRSPGTVEPAFKRLKQSSGPISTLKPHPSGSLDMQPQFLPATPSKTLPVSLQKSSQTPFQSPVVLSHVKTSASFPHEDKPSNAAVNTESLCKPSVDPQEKTHSLLSNTLPTTPHVRLLPVNSPSNRKELVLSTDNIAAMLKETIKPKHMANLNDTVIKSGGESAGNEGSTLTSTQNVTHYNNQAVVPSSLSQQPLEDQNNYFDPPEVAVKGLMAQQLDCYSGLRSELKSMYFLPVIRNKSVETNAENEDENQEIPSDDQRCCSSPDIFSGQIENAPELSEEDRPYDFNGDYGDMSLQSPPAFEEVMSPAPANLDSSPSISIDEDTQGNMSHTSSFGAFDFFSKPRSTFDSEEGKEKSNPFSFMF